MLIINIEQQKSVCLGVRVYLRVGCRVLAQRPSKSPVRSRPVGCAHTRHVCRVTTDVRGRTERRARART